MLAAMLITTEQYINKDTGTNCTPEMSLIFVYAFNILAIMTITYLCLYLSTELLVTQNILVLQLPVAPMTNHKTGAIKSPQIHS